MSLHALSWIWPCTQVKIPKSREMSIRPTQNADFLPFGYSFEQQIDWEGSWHGPRTPIPGIHEFGPDQCRASAYEAEDMSVSEHIFQSLDNAQHVLSI